tara:strand:+ start:143 stop:406 length:264 start_codon:yes stop_codon:yes gene_type:complete
MNKTQKIITFFAFLLIYVFPHYINYRNNGIVFSGNINLKNSKNINNFENLIIYATQIFSESFYIFNNGIFLFFISAVIFQYIIKILK